MTLGTYIKGLRLTDRLTAEELAFLVGVNKSTILRWEKDEVLPGKDNLEKLASALNTTIKNLMRYAAGDSEENNPSDNNIGNTVIGFHGGHYMTGTPSTEPSANPTDVGGNLIGYNPDGSYKSLILSKAEYHALMVVLQAMRN